MRLFILKLYKDKLQPFINSTCPLSRLYTISLSKALYNACMNGTSTIAPRDVLMDLIREKPDRLNKRDRQGAWHKR